MWSASNSVAQSDKPAVSSPGQSMDEKWGIKPLSIRPTAEGFFIDFRYRIVDEEKAAPLFSPTIKPLLIDENTGAIMAVPTVPKVGSMRSTRKPITGRDYVILFANPNNHIKPGHKVTVVIGNYRAEHLIVEGDESSGTYGKQKATGKRGVQMFTDQSRPIEVKKGMEFGILLEANHTTGYCWEILDGGDKNIVELVESDYKVTDEGKVGSGGREVWTFRAKSPGKTRISFRYARAWEKDVDGKTASFEIVVQ